MNAVITYLFGKADLLRDPVVSTPNTKYIVFTDNIEIQSTIWEPYQISCKSQSDIRANVAKAKFNPFIIPSNKYIILDASHQITADLSDVFDKITDTTMCVKPHPEHVNLGNEIGRWQTIRHMNQYHSKNIRMFIELAGTHFYNTPIYEGCFMGISNSSLHKQLFNSVLSMLQLLQYGGVWFPSNQIALSFLISKMNIPVTPINANQYVNRYEHNTWRLIHETT